MLTARKAMFNSVLRAVFRHVSASPASHDALVGTLAPIAVEISCRQLSMLSSDQNVALGPLNELC